MKPIFEFQSSRVESKYSAVRKVESSASNLISVARWKFNPRFFKKRRSQAEFKSINWHIEQQLRMSRFEEKWTVLYSFLFNGLFVTKKSCFKNILHDKALSTT